MTEIGLLIAGVLVTKQSSESNLPKQQLFQMENGVQQSMQGQLEITAHVTTPEFIQADGNSQTALSGFTQEKQSNKKIRKKNHSLGSSDIAEPKKYSQSLSTSREKAVGRFQKFSNQSLPTLHFGSSGLAVRALQRLLVSNGYVIRVDGIFGALTETAVKSFQNQRDLTVDGIVGQRTWRALTI